MARSRFNDPIEPMDLGNMRQNDVRSLDVSCWLCHHRAILSAAPWEAELPRGIVDCCFCRAGRRKRTLERIHVKLGHYRPIGFGPLRNWSNRTSN